MLKFITKRKKKYRKILNVPAIKSNIITMKIIFLIVPFENKYNKITITIENINVNLIISCYFLKFNIL